MARQGRRKTHWLVPVAIIVAVIGGLAWAGFTFARSYTAPRDQYPVQGIAISEKNGAISWPTMAALKINFAYMMATKSSDYRDPTFMENYKQAADAGVGFGAMHGYSLCRLASDQSENFVTTVPRKQKAMPPVVTLDFEEGCEDRPARALVLSELTTFLNQIEAHSGKAAILKLSKPFEDAYRISADINRPIWLSGNYFPPDYASKPWLMWSDNDGLVIEGANIPLEHVVIRQTEESNAGANAE